MSPTYNIVTIIITLLTFSRSINAAADDGHDERGHKQINNVLSIFNLVKFPNDVCEGAGGTNGTCYTAEECTSLGGVAKGSCASGLGVCCVLTYYCDGQSDLNNTYFKSSGTTEGSCRYKVCPCNENICSLRLDFLTFDIAGPDTQSDNTPRNDVRSRCLEDRFSVSAPGQTPYGNLCGLNTGAHLYVDSSPMCNELNFVLGQQNSQTNSNKATPAWDIRISQIPCGSVTKPPSGCTQYYYGSTSGNIQSFNWKGGRHLADQRHKICFRQELNLCRICFTQAETTDFDTVSMDVTSPSNLDSCFTSDSYRDYLIVPALSTKTSSRAHSQSILCGSAQRITGFGVQLTTPNSQAIEFTSKTLCTRMQPFMLTFYTDDWESDDTSGYRGFNLNWEQQSCARDSPQISAKLQAAANARRILLTV